MTTLTLETDLIAGDWYMITGSRGTVAGKHIKTKGNDHEYPSFQIDTLHGTGYIASVRRDHVLGKISIDHDQR